MRRVVQRVLPDGTIGNAQPFHICLEGLEKAVLCRDDKDYDAFVKIICLAARRNNVIVVIYVVVSNHSHATVLARCQDDADSYGEEVKKMASMWVSGRYGERKLLRRVDMKAPCLDSDWYLRNTLAYVPRNALDNGCNVNEYRWSGYRAMFRGRIPPGAPGPVRKVAEMTRRETGLSSIREMTFPVFPGWSMLMAAWYPIVSAIRTIWSRPSTTTRRISSGQSGQ